MGGGQRKAESARLNSRSAIRVRRVSTTRGAHCAPHLSPLAPLSIHPLPSQPIDEVFDSGLQGTDNGLAEDEEYYYEDGDQDYFAQASLQQPSAVQGLPSSGLQSGGLSPPAAQPHPLWAPTSVAQPSFAQEAALNLPDANNYEAGITYAAQNAYAPPNDARGPTRFDDRWPADHARHPVGTGRNPTY